MHDVAVKVGGRVVGVFQGRSFVMKRVGSRHVLRFPREAWCISEAAFYADVLTACDEVVVIDEESATTYTVSTKVFERHCFPVQRGNFEPQLGLALKYFEVATSADMPTSQEPARQLEFFKGGAPCAIS